MPAWLRWLLISGTYIHTGFKHCAERDGHYFLVSLVSSASTPSPHPAIHFSPSASFIHLPLSRTTSRNPHPPSLSHLRLSPFHPFVAVLSFPYITPLFLVSPLHQSCPHFSPPPPSASLSPVSHYIHSQTPVSRLLPLRISSSLSLIRPRLTAYPSLLCSFITFSSQTGLDGHSTW